MSGHSKWSTIKRKKGAADAKRGKIFTKIAREIMVSARTGGGDPDANPRLRLALAAAKSANMPKDNQERAIKKGLGDLGGATLEEAMYEGRGPNGTAFLIEVMTDNKNRTVAEIRHVFSKAGGELGSGGSMAWMFDLKGVITIPKANVDEDTLTEQVIEGGGDDVIDDGDQWVVLSDPSALSGVQSTVDAFQPTSAARQYLPKPESMIALSGDAAVKAAQFWSRIDDLDDVQTVFTNASMPDEILEEHGP